MEAQVDRKNEALETEDTRERILSAAQKLFADKSFDSISVRDITAEAGCNVASVNYHFGGKENLYLETFRSVLTFLRDHRLSVLDELIDRSPPPTLEGFLESFAESFIDPLADESRGRLFMALVSREIYDARLPNDVFVAEFIRPMLERSLLALEKFGPPLEPAEAHRCIMSLVGQLLHALKAHHLFAQHDGSEVMSASLAHYIPHFVHFSAGGIRACSASASAWGSDAKRPEESQ